MIPDRSTFESAYAGQAPWDIGKPQKPFLDVADRIGGSALAAGCGTGDTALFLAERGCQLTGIDFLEVRSSGRGGRRRSGARRSRSRRGRPDAQGLDRAVRQRDRQRLVPRLRRRGPAPLRRRAGDGPQAGRSAVPAVLKRRGAGRAGSQAGVAGGTARSLCRGLGIESIEPVRIEVRPNFKEFSFSDGGPKAWFVVVRRKR